MRKTCAHCQEEFEAKRSRAMYCSSKCKSAFRKANGEPNALCAFCGEPFFRLLSKVRYCSHRCSTEDSKGIVPVKKLVCIDCGSSFVFHGRTKRLRCDTCRSQYASRYQMEWRAARDPHVQPGIGSGGNQHWDTSKAHAQNREAARLELAGIKKHLLRSQPICRACLKSLHKHSRPVLHHIDMDATNNGMSNISLLCRTCHITVHNLMKAQALDQGWSRELCLRVFEEYVRGFTAS